MFTRFILIQTSHAGNVGGTARAMKTMGFDDLVLVAPRWANVLRREETIQRASGANDVLANARIVETLEEALDGVDHLCATAMTPRARQVVKIAPIVAAPIAGALPFALPLSRAEFLGAQRFTICLLYTSRCV